MTASHADAWNPGLESDIPTRLWPQVTLFRPENAFVSYQEASELSDLTGFKILELVSFRPDRLLTHALLVRVTAELSVQDGPSYEELGINLRGMVEKIRVSYMLAHMDRITAEFDNERMKVQAYVNEQLSMHFDPSPADQREGNAEKDQPFSLLQRWFGQAPKAKQTAPTSPPETRAVEYWNQLLSSAEDALQQACLTVLIRTVSKITGHRGRMLPDLSLVARIVTNQVCNAYGFEVLDQSIDALWMQAVEAEGYRKLPSQTKPVIMNVKGASAAGKSTIRPQQRRLSEKLGIAWDDFALISPDYWRKYLLDYESLNEDHKYGAMLTGWELEIIDKKLDRYMAGKASSGAMPHLLIDRFRFDSFMVDRPADSKLLSRFGDQIYLFFMVTHPAETVLRAFERGSTTGRYKAVDDLLHHNVEAFTGMPSLFLSWVNLKGRRIHFEFLDNDVQKGELPRTAAFGWNETLVILDVKLLLDIDRYKKVNIAARQPEDIFSEADLAPEANTDFIVRCAKTVNKIVFADQQTVEEYATLIDAELVWWDVDYIEQHSSTVGLLEILKAVGYDGQRCDKPSANFKNQIDIDTEQHVTVGRWNRS